MAFHQLLVESFEIEETQKSLNIKDNITMMKKGIPYLKGNPEFFLDKEDVLMVNTTINGFRNPKLCVTKNMRTDILYDIHNEGH